MKTRPTESLAAMIHDTRSYNPRLKGIDDFSSNGRARLGQGRTLIRWVESHLFVKSPQNVKMTRNKYGTNSHVTHRVNLPMNQAHLQLTKAVKERYCTSIT